MTSKMLTFTVLSLCLCLCLANENKNNPDPCMPNNNPKAYQTFLKRHLSQDAPTSYDQNEWQNFIWKIHTSGKYRPTQSFLSYADKQRVLGVCSPSGGKIHQVNLCISKQEFSFTTVHVNQNNGDILNIVKETKYLILACDEIKSNCLPVHFERNPYNVGPNDTHSDCQRPNEGGEAGFMNVAPAVFLLALLWLANRLRPH